MALCLRYVEETLVLSQGLVLGGSLSLHNTNNGRLPHRPEGPLCAC